MNKPSAETFALPTMDQPTQETTDVHIRINETSNVIASSTLLGQNLEMSEHVGPGFLTDRLDNPKFCGPADPQTGIAPGWQPRGANMGGIRCQLTPGMSMSGNESQLLHSYVDQGGNAGILQTDRYVKAGETLEVELWAKACHQPVKLLIGIGPLPSRAPMYDSASLLIDTAYWTHYRATLRMPCDDNHAVFYCLIEGEGLLWIDQIHMRPVDTPHVDQQMLERISSLDIPVLRFPGGCISTNYHWRHGTGPIQLRPALPDPVFKGRMCYDFGLDEYLDLCFSQNIQPHLTVNIGSGTPDDARDLATYCAKWFMNRTGELPAIYFQMGNEHYGVWESAHMTADMYTQALHAFVPPVKQAYSNARIIALGEPIAYGLRPEMNTNWRDTVLRDAGNLFDVIAINRYKGQWYDNEDDRLLNAVESVAKISRDLRELIAACRNRNINARVALTEWNFWLYASHWDNLGFKENFDVQHGLFVAGMLNEMIRLAPDVELANYYHLVNAMGIFAKHAGQVEETGAAELFRLYRSALPGRVVPLTITSPELADGLSSVDGICTQNNENTWLFLANRSLHESARINIAGGMPEDSATILAGTSLTSGFSKYTAKLDSGTITLPPMSIARVRVNRVKA